MQAAGNGRVACLVEGNRVGTSLEVAVIAKKVPAVHELTCRLGSLAVSTAYQGSPD